jgi:hypothetical protein
MRSKKNIKIAVLLIVIVSLWCGCEWMEPPEPVLPEPAASSKIIDGETGESIAGVKVTVGGQTVVTTEDGNFLIDNLEIGEHTLLSSANGYAFTTQNIRVTDEVTIMNSIHMKKLGATATVGGTGAVVNDTLPGGRFVSLEIPSQALPKETTISLTPLEGVEAGIFPDDVTPLAIVDIHTATDVQLLKPVTISFTLPMIHTPDTQIPLLIFNEQTLRNEHTGLVAVVGVDGKTATAQVNRLGRYTLITDGAYDFQVFNETCSIIEQDTTPLEGRTVTFEHKAGEDKIDLTEVYPKDLSLDYALAMIERIKGTKVGVDYQTTIVFNDYPGHESNVAPSAMLAPSLLHWLFCTCKDKVKYLNSRPRCPRGQYAAWRVVRNDRNWCRHGAIYEVRGGVRVRVGWKCERIENITWREWYCKHDQGGGR